MSCRLFTKITAFLVDFALSPIFVSVRHRFRLGKIFLVRQTTDVGRVVPVIFVILLQLVISVESSICPELVDG